MKKPIVILLMAIPIFINLIAWAEPIGFRSLQWGEHVNHSQFNCTIYEDDKNLANCSKKGENLSIGGAELKHISYFLYKDMLESVFITVGGYDNSQQVFKSFQMNYGEGYPKYKNTYSQDDWQWNTNDVFISYTYDTYKCQSVFIILSKKMSEFKKHDLDNAITNSSKDF